MKGRFVVGFLFSPCLTQVVLIQKNRPEWQAGKWNGVGGKVEDLDQPKPHEQPLNMLQWDDLQNLRAQQREWTEETSAQSPEWRLFCRLRGNAKEGGQIRLSFFCATGSFNDVRTATDETVQVHLVNSVMSGEVDIVPNLRWVLGMALRFLTHPHPYVYNVVEDRP